MSRGGQKPRHGFRLTCPICKGQVSVGGIETQEQRKQIKEDYIRLHAEGHGLSIQDAETQLDIQEDSHAAELAHIAAQKSTRQTVTGTTFTTLTNGEGTISSAFFVPGKKYLILANAQLDGSNIASVDKVRVQHGSTTFPDSDYAVEADSVGARYTYTWWTVWTAASGEGLNMQIANESASNITGIDLSTLMAIKLSDDLVENTDWFFNETSTATTLTASDSTTNNATIGPFTPATGGQSWLVMSRARHTLVGAGATVETISKIARSGEATSTDPAIQRQMEDATNETPVFSNIRVFTLGAVSNTFAEKSLAAVATGGSRSHSGIFALNLSSKLRNFASSTYSTAGVSISNITNYAVTVATTSITPAVAGDVLVLGSFTYTSNTLTATCRARIQLDNATENPAGQTSKAYVRGDPQTATEKIAIQNISIFNTTAAAHTIDLDGSVSATGTTRTAGQTQLVALTMELMPVPQAYKININEDVEMQELEPDNPIRMVKTVAESVNVTEPTIYPERIRVIKSGLEKQDFLAGDFLSPDFQLYVPSTTDIEGPLTISEQTIINLALPGIRWLPETIDITESLNKVQGWIKNITESIDITETLSNLLNRVREPSPLDALGISEVALVFRELARMVSTENLDISEVATVMRQLSRVVDLESVSITEALSMTRRLIRNLGYRPVTTGIDFLDVDFVNTDFAIGETVPGSDYLPISEAVSRLLHLVRTIGGIDDKAFMSDGFLDSGYRTKPSEIVEILENTPAAILGAAKTLTTETIDIMESVVRSGGLTPPIVKIINEAIEIQDLVSRLSNLVRATNEDLSVTEVDNLVTGLIRAVNEQIDVTEILNQQKGLARIVNESSEILEDAKRNLSLARVVNETEELVEAITQAMGKIRAIDEQVDLSEYVLSLLTEPGIIKKNVAPEQVDISETITKIQTLVRNIEESVNIEETAPFIRDLAQIINETIGIDESQLSVKGKALVVSEAIEVTDEVLTRLEINVAPPIEVGTGLGGGHIYGKRRRPPFYHPRLLRQQIQYVYPIPAPEKPIEEKPIPQQGKQKVKKTLTVRYEIEGIQVINLPELEARALINQLSAYDYTHRNTHTYTDEETANSEPYQLRATNPPINKRLGTRQSARVNDDVILLKAPVKTSLTVVYNQAQTIKPFTPLLFYDVAQTVSATFTIRYDKRVSVSTNLSASYNMKDGPKFEKLIKLSKINKAMTANLVLLSAATTVQMGEE